MKKLHFFLSVMLLTLVSVGFTSCGDDKDEPKSADIVGTWQVQAVDEDGASYESLVQFTKSGKWNSVDIYTDEVGVQVEVDQGTYTISGNKVTVTYTEDGKSVSESFTYEVKNNKLMITYQDFPVAVTFVRVKDSVIEQYLN